MIEFLNVSKKYLDGFTSLHNITFSVPDGGFLFLTGESGAGKSTLLRFIYRADRPSEGSVIVNGTDVAAVHGNALTQLRRSCGVVMQDYMLLFDRSVFRNVAMPLEVRGISRTIVRQKVEAALELVKMTDSSHQLCRSLSGGEKQRVALARALITTPDIIVADEPTGNLDQENGKTVIDVLRAINKTGTAVIMATHDLYLIESTRLPYVRIHGGSKVDQGNL